MASPLKLLMEEGVKNHTVVRSPDNQLVYTGFANFHTLAKNEENVFMPMNSNRAMNLKVVEQRVQENLNHFADTGRWLDFGQINFLVIDSEPRKVFYIMDGQHRCATMMELAKKSSHPIYFQFRVKVVEDENQANRDLEHFQRSYPVDPRSFFQTQEMTRLATQVLNAVRNQWYTIFRDVDLSVAVAKRSPDPDRPFLSDFLFFWLLKSSGLLKEGNSSAAVLAKLLKVNSAVRRLVKKNKLDKVGNPSEAMLAKITKCKSDCDESCYLGLFRPGKLEWKQVEEMIWGIQPHAPLRISGGSHGGNTARGGTSGKGEASSRRRPKADAGSAPKKRARTHE